MVNNGPEPHTSLGTLLQSSKWNQKMKPLGGITKNEKGAELRACDLNSQVTFYRVSTLCGFSQAPWAFIFYPFSKVPPYNLRWQAGTEENHKSQLQGGWHAHGRQIQHTGLPGCRPASARQHLDLHPSQILPRPSVFQVRKPGHPTYAHIEDFKNCMHNKLVKASHMHDTLF